MSTHVAVSITLLGSQEGNRSNCVAVLEGQGSEVILGLEVKVTQREENYLAKITYLEWTQCYALLAS